MKNFFKKLSFVLAIAMVLTSLAPATASAAAKNYVKDSRTGKKVTAIYAYIGGSEATLTPYVNGKKASKVTIENSDPTKVDVSNKGVVTPLKNGTATLTFKSGKTTIAKVTVKARTRAKSLNIYDRAEYAAGKKEKLTEVALKVGETKDLQVTMPISKAAKKAGGKKSSYFAYAKSSNEDVVTVTKNDDTQRNFTVKAVAAGSAKVTIVANQKTEKNVKADKYFVEASFDVTVKDETLTAEQAGNKVIKVTGTDLTDKVADYVVKKGNATLSVKAAYVKEGDTSAVNLTFPTKLGKNEYTVKFKDGDAVTVATEEQDIANIEFLYDAVIAKTVSAGACTTAEAFYKVTNQWGEDITADTTINTVAGSSLMLSGGPGTLSATNKDGKITVSSIPAGSGILGVSQFTFTIVCTTNGKNATKTLTLSKAAEVSEINILGVYKPDATQKLVLTDVEKDDNTTAYYLIIDAKDQYGRSVTTTTDLNIPGNGFFNVSATCEATPQKVDGVSYLTYKVTGPAIAGTAKVIAISTKNGTSASKDINVVNPVQIKTFTAKPVDSVLYNGVKAEFEYEALDSEGNAVTAYSKLRPVMTVASNNLPSGFTWERQADGSAKLFYTPNVSVTTNGTNTGYTMLPLSFKTPLFGFSNVTVTVYEKPIVKGILGVTDTTKTAMLAGNSVGLTVANFKFYDQYNNEMSADAVVAQTGVKIVVVSSSAVAFNAVNDYTTPAISDKAEGVVTASSIAGKNGSQYVTVKIDGVANSDYTVEFVSASLDQVTGLEVGALPKYQVATGAVTTAEVGVTGYVGGAKIALEAGKDFAVVSNNDSTGKKVVIPATQALAAGLKEGELEFEVQVFNTANTTLKGKVAYSNANPVLTTVGVYKKASVVTQSGVASAAGAALKDVNFLGTENAPASNAASKDATNGKILFAFDQYNGAVDLTDATLKSTTRYNVSVVDADADGDGNKVKLTINKNNSALANVTVVGATGQTFILHIEYTFANGLTAAADVLYDVQ